MPSSETGLLLAWCAENRIQIDHGVRVINTRGQPDETSFIVSDGESPRQRGFSVYSCEQLIESNRTLVYIPKTAVLSVRSSSFSRHIASVPYGHGAHLSLALALYGELFRGPHSRWFGYLQSLPRETMDIAVFWGIDDVIKTQPCACSPRGCLNAENESSFVEEPPQQMANTQCPWCVRLHDGQTARRWLGASTEFDREQGGLMEEIRQYYHDVVVPTFSAVLTNPGLEHPASYDSPDRPEDSTADSDPSPHGVSFPDFCHAYSLVSTRAFWVDSYHGLAMVPIADAFNHSNDNHVQMESDYDVCVECGSLAECEHDREVADTTVVSENVRPLSHDGPLAPSKVDYLEMRTVRPVPPFSQVFNTYGSLPNAVLLSRYGFILPENEHDIVRMALDPYSTVKDLFNYLGLDEASDSAGDDAVMVMEASPFGGLAIRNAFRVGDFTDHGGVDRAVIYDKERRQPYNQGIVDEGSPRQSRLFEGVGAELLARNDGPLSEAPTGKNDIDRVLHVFTHIAGTWDSEATWDEEDDGLIFNPQPHLTGPVSFLLGPGGMSGGSVRLGHDLVINSDGKLSHNLWLFCILVAIFAVRSQLSTSFGELMTRVERDPEAITSSLADIKVRLINVQGCAERLRRMEDDGDIDNRDNIDRDRMEGVVGGDGGNHESTRTSPPPPLPHLVSALLSLDYDSGSDAFSQPATIAQEQQPRSQSIAIETRSDFMSSRSTSNSPHPDWDSSAAKFVSGGPQDRAIRSTGFSSFSISQPCSSAGPVIACHHRTTRESYQQQGEKPSPESATSTMITMRTEPKDVDHGTGYHVPRREAHQWQRDRSLSLVADAEGERPTKRVRSAECSSSGSIAVVNRENSMCRTDRSGRATSESAARRGRQGQIRQEGPPVSSPRDDDGDGEDEDATTRRLARLLARIVIRLCHDRYRPRGEGDEDEPRVAGMGMTAAQLGNVLDGVLSALPKLHYCGEDLDGHHGCLGGCVHGLDDPHRQA